MNLFNAVFTAFGSFFSRSFWLGAFTPVASAAVVHALIASQVFPTPINLLRPAGDGALDKLSILSLAVAGLVVLSYAVSPFIGLLRGMLDGQLLPEVVHEALRDARYATYFRAREKLRSVRDHWGDLKEIDLEAVETLLNAKTAGEQMDSPTDDEVKGVAVHIEPLDAQVRKGGAPTAATARKAYDALTSLLRSASAGRTDPNSEALDRLRRTFLDILTTSLDLLEVEIDALQTRSRREVKLKAPEATLVGDERQITERYCSVTYGVSFDFIWPRLLLLLEETPDKAKTLEAAQTQIDFAVLTLALSMTVPLVWLPLMAVYGHSLGLVAAVAVFGLLAWPFFYHLVVQSQGAFAGVVQAIIDRRHLDLLTALGQQRPQTVAAERELWSQLQMGAEGGRGSFHYAAAGAPGALS